jgi:transcriptional regulator with XRE-family HTH domain
MTIKQLVKTTRKHLGETQKQFSTRFGVSPAAISGWERGYRVAPDKIVEGCLDILNQDGLAILKRYDIENEPIEEPAEEAVHACEDPSEESSEQPSFGPVYVLNEKSADWDILPLAFALGYLLQLVTLAIVLTP